MPHYRLGRFFSKHWFWFENPHEVQGADMVNFFSYHSGEYPGFIKRETLTSVIDLERPIEDIWHGMRAKFIRQQIERGERRGVVVRRSEDMNSFYPMYLAFRKQRGLARERFEILKENGILFLAYSENMPVAGGVFIGDGETIRAWVLASKRLASGTGRARDVIGEANRMVLWEAIKWAKKAGYKRFDMGGIDPSSSNPAALSLAEFKDAFGGTRMPAYYYHRVYSKLLRAWIGVRHWVR